LPQKLPLLNMMLKSVDFDAFGQLIKADEWVYSAGYPKISQHFYANLRAGTGGKSGSTRSSLTLPPKNLPCP